MTSLPWWRQPIRLQALMNPSWWTAQPLQWLRGQAPSVWPVPMRASLLSVVAATAGLVLSAAVLPGVHSAQDAARLAHARLHAQLTQSQLQLAALPRLQEERQQWEAYAAQHTALVPSELSVTALLETLAQLGHQRSVQFEFFKPQPEVRRELVAQVPVQFKAVGSFHAIGLLLADMAQLAPIVHLSHLSLQAPPGQSELTLEATALTYRFLLATHNPLPTNPGAAP